MTLPDIKKVSELLEPLLKEFEGFRAHAYWDGKQWSIGFGSGTYANGKRVKEHDVVTLTEAIKIMQADLKRTRFPAILRYVKVPLSIGETAALASFAYNKGAGGLRDSEILKLLNQGADKKKVARAFAQYNKNASGKVMKGLTRRRAAEAAVFLT